MPVAGLMAEYLGWPSIFYIFGAVGLVWFTCWWIVVKDRPEDDTSISKMELEYIKAALGDDIKKEVHYFIFLSILLSIGRKNVYVCM